MSKNYISGQTLIEALITVLFITFSTIALIRFQNYLAYDNNLSQQRSEAISQGSSKLEELRNFQVQNNITGYTSYQSIVSGSSSVTGTTATYSITWTVTPFTNPTYKTINLTVTWTDRYGSAQSIQLITTIPGIDPPNSAIIM